MEIGDVSAQDILAPYSLSFESEVLTEQSRQEAENAVDPVYLPADPGIGSVIPSGKQYCVITCHIIPEIVVIGVIGPYMGFIPVIPLKIAVHLEKKYCRAIIVD